MLVNDYLNVKHIFQDLHNLRNVPQVDELSAMKALITINPDYFYGLMESIIENGYLPLENIVVIKETAKRHKVKEGNRRIAIMKILLGLYPLTDFDLPQSIINKIKTDIDKKWIAANTEVPCLIYEPADIDIVNRIISLVHAKGEKAGRLRWSSVGRAREARNVNNKPQPILDLLEKYLRDGKNTTAIQRETWAADYPLTVLDEAIARILPRTNIGNSTDLANQYPKVPFRTELEAVMSAIGSSIIQFPTLRDPNDDILSKYGFAPPASPAPPAGGGAKSSGKRGGSGANPTPTSPPAPPAKPTKGAKAYSTNDPRSVRKLLKGLQPTGADRDKVVDLCNEAILLNIANTPLAFCFVLRSMLEISAKAYCKGNGISLTITKQKKSGTHTEDKSLAKLLGEVSKDIAGKTQDGAVKRALHGANAELAKADGMLSVTSLNQLVHNPNFSIAPNDICRLFSNIFPLLEHMN